MAPRRSSALTSSGPTSGARQVGKREARDAPRLYTAQALADFCEVDLKTVHHWAERGKIPHHRTEGRHLRFRRNDVVRFLRALGYPLPASLTRARPVVALATTPYPADAPLTLEELAKRLASRFSVRRYQSPLGAIAHLISEAPDVLVLGASDPALSLAQAVSALKSDPSTAWVVVATLGGDDASVAAARDAGAEVAIPVGDAARLAPELARVLAVA